MKSTEEIYENSMLEDDPNEESERNAQQPRWGPKNKGAQILANFYSRGTRWIKIKNAIRKEIVTHSQANANTTSKSHLILVAPFDCIN